MLEYRLHPSLCLILSRESDKAADQNQSAVYVGLDLVLVEEGERKESGIFVGEREKVRHGAVVQSHTWNMEAVQACSMLVWR